MSTAESTGSERVYRLGPRLVLSVIRERGPCYRDPISTSAAVYRLIGEEAASWDRERFLAVLLDGKNRVLGLNEVSVGTLTASLVHPREVFKAALIGNAAAIIVVHNHPSGDPTPSVEDIAITHRLREAGELLGIRILDHVILGDGRYVSFSDEGL